MSRSDRAAKGFATGILRVIAQIAVTVLLAPIVLKVAGRETLGAYSAIAQVLAFITVTGFMGAWVMERFLGMASGLDDGGTRFRCIFTTVKTVMLITATVEAILILIFSFFVPRLFHLSPHLGHEAEMALWLIAFAVVVRSPLAAYSNALYAMQDMAGVNLIGTCTQTARAVATLLAVLAGFGLFGLVSAGAIVEGVGYYFYRVRFKKKNPGLMPGWGIPDKHLLKEMAGYGLHAMLVNAGNALLFNTGNTVAGITEGAAMASSFYTSQAPGLAIYNMMMRFPSSAMPALNELWGRREMEKIREALSRMIRLLLALMLPLATGIVVFNRDVVTVWVGLRQYAGPLLTVSLAAFCIIASLQRIAVVCTYTFGWMRLLAVTALVQGIANFGLAFILARWLGLGGIVLALTVVVLPQTVILWQRIGQFLRLNVYSVLAGCAVRSAIPLAGAVVCGVMVHRLTVVEHRHFAALIAEVLTFLAVYACLAYPLVLFDRDRQDVRRYVGATLGRVGLNPTSRMQM